MANNTRSMKVYSRYVDRSKTYRPQIRLEGLWLAESGFDVGDYISVTCENGRLVITPDHKRRAWENSLAESMEMDMAALKQQYAVKRKVFLHQSIKK